MCRSAEGASHEGTWQTQIDLRDRPCRIHPRCGHLSRPGAPSLLGRDPPYFILPYLPVYRPPLPHTLVSDCTVPCRYVVHTGYAYPSALLWADLLSNKVGPSQSKTLKFGSTSLLAWTTRAPFMHERTGPSARPSLHQQLAVGKHGAAPPGHQPTTLRNQHSSPRAPAAT